MADVGRLLPPELTVGLPVPPGPGDPVFLLSKLLKKLARTPSLVVPAVMRKENSKSLHKRLYKSCIIIIG